MKQEMIYIGTFENNRVMYDVQQNEVYLQNNKELRIPNTRERFNMIEMGLVDKINDILK